MTGKKRLSEREHDRDVLLARGGGARSAPTLGLVGADGGRRADNARGRPFAGAMGARAS
jgi:hypothetical protein